MSILLFNTSVFVLGKYLNFLAIKCTKLHNTPVKIFFFFWCVRNLIAYF